MKGVALAVFVLTATACDRSDPDEPVMQVDTDSAVGEPAGSASPTAATDSVAANLPETSACAETEGTIFSCRIRDGRMIAVCVRRDEQGREFAQYRFGKPDGTPELVWPTSFAERGMQWASVPYSGGGETQLSFARGEIRYVIYSRIVRTGFGEGVPNNPKFEDGAYVYRAERRISDLPCAGQADEPVSVPMAERFAQQQDDLFTD